MELTRLHANHYAIQRSPSEILFVAHRRSGRRRRGIARRHLPANEVVDLKLSFADGDAAESGDADRIRCGHGR